MGFDQSTQWAGHDAGAEGDLEEDGALLDCDGGHEAAAAGGVTPVAGVGAVLWH